MFIWSVEGGQDGDGMSRERRREREPHKISGAMERILAIFIPRQEIKRRGIDFSC
jgi:hypothetical protein